MELTNRSLAVMRSWRETAAAILLFSNYDDYFAALEHKGSHPIVLRTRRGLNITVRQNLWDARIVKEMFVERPYLRHIHLPPSPVVVDVGGYIGDFSLYAVEYLGARRVVVYEPTAENFRVLQQNILANGFDARVTAVNAAVSNTNEETLFVEKSVAEELHVSAYMYPHAEKRVVPAVTLDQLLESHGLPVVDLLKVDCEGGEYDIFPAASEQALRRVRNIVFELHEIEGYRSKLETVLAHLGNVGFDVRVEGLIAYATTRVRRSRESHDIQ